MRSRTLALVLAVAIALLGVLAFALTRADPGAKQREEGERLWREAVWFTDRVPFREAIIPLEFAKRAGVRDDDLLFMLASSYLFEGESDTAFELGKELTDRSPDHPGVHLLRGFALGRDGDADGAFLSFQSALALLGGKASRDPLREEIDYMGRWWRGEQNLVRGEFESAATDLDAAIAAHEGRGSVPPDTLILSAVAAHKRMDEHDEGFALLAQALALRPGHPSFLLQRALMLADEQSDRAAPAFEQAAEADPRNPTPLLKLAALDRLNGMLPSMEERLKSVRDLLDRDAMILPPHILMYNKAELAAGWASYWFEMGQSHRAAGEPGLAKKAYADSLRYAREALNHYPKCFRVQALIRKLATFSDVPRRVREEAERAIEEGHDAGPAIADASRTFC